GLSKSTIYREMKAGRFPQQKSLGVRGVGWAEHEIDRFLANVIGLGHLPD
ncbi:MAG: AlpA family phage regulatory protein, partial [Lentisphaeria bacterium]|nr:AlpA family phage regulatory protein [Lentisphaeria bacterium]